MNKLLSLLFTVACALLVSTIAPIATVSGAQKGHSPIDSFDVIHDGEVVGEVRVNTAKAKTLTYVLVADGLTPKTKYTFGYFTYREKILTCSAPRTRPSRAYSRCTGYFALRTCRIWSRHGSG